MVTRWDNNRYGDPIEVSGCGTFIRDDDRYGVEVYVDWLLYERLGYRMALSHEWRDSNCDAFDYGATVVSAGIALGWF
jgi:hypothetical protein